MILLTTLIEHRFIHLPSTIHTCCSKALYAKRTRLREEVLPEDDIAKKQGWRASSNTSLTEANKGVKTVLFSEDWKLSIEKVVYFFHVF